MSNILNLRKVGVSMNSAYLLRFNIRETEIGYLNI